MSCRKSSQGMFISEDVFLTCIFSAVLQGTKKTFTQLWILLQKSLLAPVSALPDTKNSVCEGQKKEWKDFRVAHWSLILISMGDCQTEKTRLLFGGMWSNVQQSSVFKLCVLIFMYFFLFYTENCKTCSTFITPWIQDSDSDPTSNSIFLTWLVQSLGSRLGISITNISSEKRKLFWKVLESHSFCFISNYRSEQEQSFLFSYFHLILRLVNRQDYCALHLQDFVPFRARS